MRHAAHKMIVLKDGTVLSARRSTAIKDTWWTYRDGKGCYIPDKDVLWAEFNPYYPDWSHIAPSHPES